MSGNICLVALVVLSYWLIATTMIFVNKQLMAASSQTSASPNLHHELRSTENKESPSTPKLQMTPGVITKIQSNDDFNTGYPDRAKAPAGDYSESRVSKKDTFLNSAENVAKEQDAGLHVVHEIKFVPNPENEFRLAALKSMPRSADKTSDLLSLFSGVAVPFGAKFNMDPSDGSSNKWNNVADSQLQVPVSFPNNNLDAVNDIGKSRRESIKPSGESVKVSSDRDSQDFQQSEQTSRSGDPDISVLVVWAQSVIGLTFLLTLRRLVVAFGLPVKELQHLQLPSVARHGDLDIVLAAVFQTSALIFNNLTLRFINVSFYQIARALTLVFVTLLSSCILRERIARRVGIACLLMIAGFYVGVDQEVVSQGVLPVGVMYGTVASLFAACYGVLFKRLQISSATRSAPPSDKSTGSSKKIWVNLLQKEKTLTPSHRNVSRQVLLAQTSGRQWRHPDQELKSIGSTASRITATSLQFTYYNYLTCSIALAPAVFGSCQIRDFICLEASRDVRFWCLLILSGMAGIAMSWVSSLQISLTSPLTHNISINAKSVLLTLTAVMWNGENRTGLWWAGNALVLMGVALYTATKLREQVQLVDRGNGGGISGRQGISRRLKLPARLAAVTEDVRY